MSDTNSKFLIDLDSKASPATLAGMLGISTGMVYQGQQDGKLPVKTTTTYREALHHYIGYYKKKVTSRSTSMGEAKLAQDIRNGIAREHQQWLEIKQTKEELVDITVMKELFEPTFQLLRSSLVNLARKHPAMVTDVDAMLSNLTDLGTKIAIKAELDAKLYVKSMLETEYSLDNAEEELEETFELKEEANE